MEQRVAHRILELISPKLAWASPIYLGNVEVEAIKGLFSEGYDLKLHRPILWGLTIIWVDKVSYLSLVKPIEN